MSKVSPENKSLTVKTTFSVKWTHLYWSSLDNMGTRFGIAIALIFAVICYPINPLEAIWMPGIIITACLTIIPIYFIFISPTARLLHKNVSLYMNPEGIIGWPIGKNEFSHSTGTHTLRKWEDVDTIIMRPGIMIIQFSKWFSLAPGARIPLDWNNLSPEQKKAFYNILVLTGKLKKHRGPVEWLLRCGWE
jgi:hypothetical protein